ncbi:hypothetical protein FGO68_gene13297 [Halteria grandinella]|uniref:WW domain-containing protein n=1 Tax=Halteria grandinella TaxID=5974 RepID=A0A8J8P310_HALGN|nr:hypothetical protein FGO68_gene13297 [Halteria grandinella]
MESNQSEEPRIRQSEDDPTQLIVTRENSDGEEEEAHFEIMAEEMDSEWEPEQEEIEEYARYLGIDLEKERDFLFLAKQGLMEPLLDPWTPVKSPRRGSIYYFNTETREMMEQHPCDVLYKERVIQYRNSQQGKYKKKLKKMS